MRFKAWWSLTRSFVSNVVPQELHVFVVFERVTCEKEPLVRRSF